MRSVVRRMGNSSGIIIPRIMLAEIGMKPGDHVELAIEDGGLFHFLVAALSRTAGNLASRAVSASKAI